MAEEHNSAQHKLMAALEAKKQGKSAPATTSGGGKSPAPTATPAPASGGGKKNVAPPIKLAPARASTTVLGRALLVDGNKRASQTLSSMLKTQKVEATIAATGAEALQMLNTLQPMMVLVDNDLPDIGGFNLCSKIRATTNGRDACIVMTSESFNPGMKDQALMVDANGYLGKPINYADLMGILQAFRESKRAETLANNAQAAK